MRFEISLIFCHKNDHFLLELLSYLSMNPRKKINSYIQRYNYNSSIIGLIETNDKAYLAITSRMMARSEASQRCKDIYVEDGHLHLVVFENVQEMTNLKSELKQIFGKAILRSNCYWQELDVMSCQDMLQQLAKHQKACFFQITQ